MFKVKRKNNPAIIYTVLSVAYVHGEIKFLIYSSCGQFVMENASEFDPVDPLLGPVNTNPKEDINAD